MSIETGFNVSAQAFEAAKNLQDLLTNRLVNETVHMCDGCGFGPSRVVEIRIPSTPQDIGRWTFWQCVMANESGKRWTQAIGALISRLELYPLFRNQFAGIRVETTHPQAQLHLDYCEPDSRRQRRSGDKKGRNFVASGRTVTVNQQTPAYVRPTGDLTQSCWVNASLCADVRTARYSFACIVNSLEPGGHREPADVEIRNRLAEIFELPTFYIYIPEGEKRFLPIARLIHRTKRQFTFELNQSVEAFRPV